MIRTTGHLQIRDRALGKIGTLSIEVTADDVTGEGTLLDRMMEALMVEAVIVAGDREQNKRFELLHYHSSDIQEVSDVETQL